MIDERAPRSAGGYEDDDELIRLLLRARRLARWFVRRQQVPEQDGEDLVQQTLLALVVKRSRVENPEAWVVGTLRNKIRRYWRGRRDRPVEGLEEASVRAEIPSQPPDQVRSELRQDLEAALGRLPERCRTILRMRYGLGMRSREVAERLGCSPASVRKASSRCLRYLQRELSMETEPT